MILYLVVTCGPRPVQQVVLNEPFDSHDLTQRRVNLFDPTPEPIYQLVVFLFTVHLSSSTQRKEGGNFLVFLWFVIFALCAFYCVAVQSMFTVNRLSHFQCDFVKQVLYLDYSIFVCVSNKTNSSDKVDTSFLVSNSLTKTLSSRLKTLLLPQK